MKRLLRWLSYSVGLLLLLLIIIMGTLQYYKPRILATINSELQNSINGEIQIGKLNFTLLEDFPNFSITLSDIYLRGPHYKRYNQEFFRAEKIFVHVGVIHLIRGIIDLNSITIRNGSIFIFRGKDGYTNLDVFKKRAVADSVKNTSPNSLELELGRIQFINTRASYADSLKEKSFDIKFNKTQVELTNLDSSRRIKINGNIWFGGLSFNTAKGGYLTNTEALANLDLEIFPRSNSMVVHPSSLGFQNSTVSLGGHFEFTAPGVLDLKIISEKIDYDFGRTLVPKTLGEKLGKYHLEGPIALNLTLDGTLAAGGEPKIDIAFSSRNTRFTFGKIKLDQLNLKGTFTNHVDSAKLFDDYNSRLHLDSLSGKMEGVPINARVDLLNLKDPGIDLNMSSRVSLTDLNSYNDVNRLHFVSGSVAVDFEYVGKLNEYLDSTRTSYEGKLKGSVSIKNGAVNLLSQNKKFEKVNVDIRFTEKESNLDKINFTVNGNPVQLKGIVTGFLPFFLQPDGKGLARLSIYSPRVDLSTLSQEKKTKRKVSEKEARRNRKKISDMLDVMYEKVEFNLDVKADEIVSGPMKASDFSGKIGLHREKFSAGPINMKFADGTVELSLKIADLDKEINPISLRADVRDADVKKFFSSFNNFSQKTIKSENVSGRVTTSIEIDANMDDQFNILMPSIKGLVNFKLKDGNLKDFEPLQKMSNFLFKKRDFTDVDFAEINCNFYMSGPTLDIKRMEIQSSILTLFLEGRYSLADSTDLNIQVPLSNLKKRDKDYKPENVGTDAKVGASIFLRAYNKDGKIVIAYNPFKKFKKK